jgi:hypothetical protein
MNAAPRPRTTQHQVKHAPGELPTCSCGNGPRHYSDTRRQSAGGGEFLECAPCDRRTRRHADLALAIAEFHRLVGSKPATATPARLSHVR